MPCLSNCSFAVTERVRRIHLARLPRPAFEQKALTCVIEFDGVGLAFGRKVFRASKAQRIRALPPAIA